MSQQPPQGPPQGPPQDRQQRGTPQRQPSLSRVEVDEPTVTRVTLGRSDGEVGIGEDDYILDSHYNPQYDVWEVLVLLQPRGRRGRRGQGEDESESESEGEDE